jgi:hypothetical protein
LISLLSARTIRVISKNSTEPVPRRHSFTEGHARVLRARALFYARNYNIRNVVIHSSNSIHRQSYSFRPQRHPHQARCCTCQALSPPSKISPWFTQSNHFKTPPSLARAAAHEMRATFGLLSAGIASCGAHKPPGPPSAQANVPRPAMMAPRRCFLITEAIVSPVVCGVLKSLFSLEICSMTSVGLCHSCE